VTGGDELPRRLQRAPTWLLSQAHGHARGLLAEALGVHGARGYHYRVLAALEEQGPLSQADLGRRTAIDRSDIVAVVNELEADRLVRRAPDPGDRRRNVISLTAAGRRRLARLDEAVAGVQDRLLEPLSAGERRTLVALLSRLVDRR
jgi:DNA-binding MarR family transcriptional regulator